MVRHGLWADHEHFSDLLAWYARFTQALDFGYVCRGQWELLGERVSFLEVGYRRRATPELLS
jgi:hypothetical protein